MILSKPPPPSPHQNFYLFQTAVMYRIDNYPIYRYVEPILSSYTGKTVGLSTNNIRSYRGNTNKVTNYEVVKVWYKNNFIRCISEYNYDVSTKTKSQDKNIIIEIFPLL